MWKEAEENQNSGGTGRSGPVLLALKVDEGTVNQEINAGRKRILL